MNFSEDTIQRCPHDKENPYVMVNNNLIRDNSISPECRWLLIYLLTNENGWVINTNQLVTHLKGHKRYGRDRVRSIISEAVKAGYMKRERYLYKNMIRHRYYLSETPKFSNNFTDALKSRAPGARAPETPPLKNDQEEKKDHIEESSAMPTSPPLSPANAAQEARHKAESTQIPKRSTEEAREMAEKLFDKVKSIYPKAKPPKLEKWAEQLDLMHRRDGRPWQEVSEMIDWVFEDSFWVNVIQSPVTLRTNWDKIAVKRVPKVNKGITEKQNRELAMKIKTWLSSSGEKNTLAIFQDNVYDSSLNDSISLDLPSKTFKEIIFKWYGIKGEKDV